MAVDSLARLKEGIEFGSDDESDEYSDEGDYGVDDEVVSADEYLPNERRFDQVGGSVSGNDYGSRDTADDDDRESERWQRLVSNLQKQNRVTQGPSTDLISKHGLFLGDGSVRGEAKVPTSRYPVARSSVIESSREEDLRSRSPSSGPLTTKHFDFVLTSETPAQSPAPTGPAETQAQRQIPDTCTDYPELSVRSGQTNGRFILFVCLFA